MSIKIFDELIYNRNKEIFNGNGIDDKHIKMIKCMIERSPEFVSMIAR